MFKGFFYILIGIIGTSVFNSAFQNHHIDNLAKDLIKEPISIAHADTVDQNKIVESISGVVTAVSDGDTLTVRNDSGSYIIRLFAIDAPEASCHGFSDKVCTESGQPDAKASKLYLRELTLNKNVLVKLGQGMSGSRLVGTVLSEGKDINLEMVKAGHAWHYKYFSKNQMPDDRKAYADAELNAKWLHSGLWGDNNPIAPWDYRRQH